MSTPCVSAEIQSISGNPRNRRIARILKVVLAAGLMLWVVYAALRMEAIQSTDSWDGLSSAEKWVKVWRVGPSGILDRFRAVDPLLFLASVGCVGVTVAAGVCRWKAFLDRLECPASFPQLLSITMAGYFFNSFMLGSTGGDVVKAWYAARRNPQKMESAFTSVFVDRLFGLVFMLVFAGLAMIPLGRWVSNHPEIGSLSGKMLMLGLITLAVICLSYGLFALLGRVRLPLPEWVAERLLKIRQAVGITLSSRRLWIRATLWSVIINVFCILQILALARGLGLGIEPLFLAFAVPVIICISAIPLTPSGFGIRENLYVYLLALAQTPVGAGEALALSLLAYAGTFFWNLAGGVFFLFLKAEMPVPATDSDSGGTSR